MQLFKLIHSAFLTYCDAFKLLEDDPHDRVLHEWDSDLHRARPAAAYGVYQCFQIGDPCDDWSEYVT